MKFWLCAFHETTNFSRQKNINVEKNAKKKLISCGIVATVIWKAKRVSLFSDKVNLKEAIH